MPFWGNDNAAYTHTPTHTHARTYTHREKKEQKKKKKPGITPSEHHHKVFFPARQLFRCLKQNEAQSACAESTNKGGNKQSQDVAKRRQQRHESPATALTWHASKYKVHNLHQRYIPFYLDDVYSEDVPLVEFMHIVFTRMPREIYRR